MTLQMIQISSKIPMNEWMHYSITHEQDSDSKFYDYQSADRVVELHTGTGEILALSRTRIEFKNEHFVYANSKYLKSLGNETNIYLKFLKSQKLVIKN